VLTQTFSLASHALVPGGLFLFSTEDLDASPMRRAPPPIPSPAGGGGGGSGSPAGGGGKDEEEEEGPGVELLSSGRYAHSQRYIELLAAAHCFHMAQVHSLVIRTEAAVPLPGKIFLLQSLLADGESTADHTTPHHTTPQQSIAEQSRVLQSRAEYSRAEQS
jgi:hypothetical protein